MKVILFALFFALTCTNSFGQTYFPPTSGNQWDTLSPTSLGWCQDSIDAFYTFLEEEQTDAIIVLKNGKIVLENYFGTYTADSSHLWNSASKSLRSVLIGIAQEDGILGISNKTSDYLGTGWTSLTTAQEDLITVWNQLTMTSGLDETNFTCSTPGCLNYVADAGTRWSYHNGPYGLLKDIIEVQSGQTINAYTNTNIEAATGMSGIWINLPGYSIYWSKARDMARFGLLVLNDGIWDGTTVLGDQNYIQAMRTPSQSLNPSYGYLWWLNGQSSYVTTGFPITVPGSIAPDAPSDVYAAAGAGGQYISISPSNDMVVIRQGDSGSQDLTEFSLHNEIWKRILNLSCTNSLSEDDLSNLVIYPNPTNDMIYFGKEGKWYEITVRDFSGRLIHKELTNAGVSTNGIASGSYFIEVSDGENKIIREIVIE